MDAQIFVDEAFNTSLQAILEAVFAGGNTIVNGAAGEILVSKEDSVHFGMDGKIVFHGALA